MNKEMEQFINDALRMGRELVHAGAKSTAREGATDESTVAMDAGSALLRLVYTAVKLDATVTELRIHVNDQCGLIEEGRQEIARLNTRLRDMAEESNKAAAYKSERDEWLQKYEMVNAVNDSLESILDDTERQRDALKGERDRLRREVMAIREERDGALARIERTRRDINALIEKYS